MHTTRTIALLASLAAFATPAVAQGWSYQTTPLGGGFSTTDATGPNGQHATGSTTPLGGGFSTTHWSDNYGHHQTCSTTPLGGGFSTTHCQ